VWTVEQPSIPVGFRQTDIGCEQFNRLLKTSLFWCWGRGALWIIIVQIAPLEKEVFLLTYFCKEIALPSP